MSTPESPKTTSTSAKDSRADQAHPVEIEVKFILPLSVVADLKTRADVKTIPIEQLYLANQTIQPFAARLNLPDQIDFEEWRIRRKAERFFFTAKGAASKDGTQRTEYEIEIDGELFREIKTAAAGDGPIDRVAKTRYSLDARLNGQPVQVDIDEYHQTGKGAQGLDFVSCELEVPNRQLAQDLMAGRFSESDLAPLKSGFNATGIRAFSNRYLARHGFVRENYADLKDWATKARAKA